MHRFTLYDTIYLSPGLGLEEEVPDYDLDSEDDEWLSAQTNERVSCWCVCSVFLTHIRTKCTV